MSQECLTLCIIGVCGELRGSNTKKSHCTTVHMNQVVMVTSAKWYQCYTSDICVYTDT